jgi:predicted AAA+ superfamily ATPase
VLLGSSALLVQKGLTESLAGRFELHRHFQWSYQECQKYFGLSLDEYLYFGGYPGALAMRKDEPRWRSFFRESLIETVLSKDVLLMATVTKPALLRQTFGLTVTSPAQIISYQKMVGALQDAGNTTTIATYIGLFSKAFLMTSLERLSGSGIRQRGSIPKIVVLDNGLVSAMSGQDFATARKDPQHWGRCIENAVGARLYFLAEQLGGQLFYWRERQYEVDYCLKIGKKIIGIEVKTNADKAPVSFSEFEKKFKPEKVVTIFYRKQGREDESFIGIEEFLTDPQIIVKG